MIWRKRRDILLIIVENAITYNIAGGSITFSTKVADGRFVLTIENTGLGITSEEIGKIGSALFYRGQDARKVNTVGMGVGLSVAKAIVKAHHGTFEIESDGKDKGARAQTHRYNTCIGGEGGIAFAIERRARVSIIFCSFLPATE